MSNISNAEHFDVLFKDTPADANAGVGVFQLVSIVDTDSPGTTILCEDEIITYFHRTGGSVNDPVPAIREQEGTPLESHAANTVYYFVLTSGMMRFSSTITVTNNNADIDTTPRTDPPSSFYVAPPSNQSLTPTNTNINFVDGGPPAEIESSVALGYIDGTYLSNFQGWYDYTLQGIVTVFKTFDRFSGSYDTDNERLDLTIEAGVHSEFGNLTTQIAQPRGFISSDDLGPPTEDNFPKPTGYVPGSFDYGWGPNVVPPYDPWWVFPSSSNSGQSAHSSGFTFLKPYYFPFGVLGVGASGWLNRGDPTLETNVIDSVYGQLPVTFTSGTLGVPANPYKDNNTITHDSVTTVRLHYTPGTVTTANARCGISLMEVSSRYQLGFGQVQGSTGIFLWSWTTVDDDGINNFNPLFGDDCHLNMDDIFLRIFVGKDGHCKFLYSADNVKYYLVFDLGTTTTYFRAGPTRVGVFMYHEKSYPTFNDLIHNTNHNPQNGSLNCCHWEQFVDYNDDAHIDPTTWRSTLIGTVYS